MLQQLEDEGLIEFERVNGRNTATLTDEGNAYVEEHREELGTPWEDASAATDGPIAREMGQALKGFIHGLAPGDARRHSRHSRPRPTPCIDDARKVDVRHPGGR